MKKIGLVLAAALGALTILVPSAAGARGLDQGDDNSWAIDRYTATYDIHADGSTSVTIDFVFDFGTQPGHGPYLTYVTRVLDVDGGDRFYPISDVQASSPTGAPSGVSIEEADGWLKVRIGDEDIDTVSGVQEYVLTYTLEGVLDAVMASDLEDDVAAGDDEHLFDQFVWNVIGEGWEIPLNDITIIVEGDARTLEVVCYAGASDLGDGCTTEEEADGVATFTKDHLDPYAGMTVAVLFSPGSFDTTPILESPDVSDRPTGDEAPEDASGAPIATYVAIGAGFLAVAVVGLVLRARGRAREPAAPSYPGLAPGFGQEEGQTGNKRDGFL